MKKSVEIVMMKEDLDDTTKDLMDGKNFQAELEHGCATKTDKWEERSKTRAEELVALADTIKILNDDDALDLLKKTLPTTASSFMQMAVSSSAVRARAVATLKEARKHSAYKANLNFLVLALSGKKALIQGSFDKVIKMVGTMIELVNEHTVQQLKEFIGKKPTSMKTKNRDVADKFDKTVKNLIWLLFNT
eukprot:3485569-Heterocapsa_arctica.AAC.1